MKGLTHTHETLSHSQPVWFVCKVEGILLLLQNYILAGVKIRSARTLHTSWLCTCLAILQVLFMLAKEAASPVSKRRAQCQPAGFKSLLNQPQNCIPDRWASLASSNNVALADFHNFASPEMLWIVTLAHWISEFRLSQLYKYFPDILKNWYGVCRSISVNVSDDLLSHHVHVWQIWPQNCFTS